MKKFIPSARIMSAVFSIAALIIMLCVFQTSSASEPSISKNKTTVLFSKSSEGNINIIIKTPVEKKVEFYLFRASGEFVKKINTRSRTTNTINKLSDGQYLYQCFEKDLQLTSGTLTLNADNIIYD